LFPFQEKKGLPGIALIVAGWLCQDVAGPAREAGKYVTSIMRQHPGNQTIPKSARTVSIIGDVNPSGLKKVQSATFTGTSSWFNLIGVLWNSYASPLAIVGIKLHPNITFPCYLPRIT
jgi:hypothetical protein